MSGPLDVTVTGQRRANENLTYNQRPGGGSGSGGGAGGDPGDEQDTKEDDPNSTEPYIGDPCGREDSRRLWNADARAAAAVSALANALSGVGSDFSNREAGANLYLDASNNVQLTGLTIGDPAVSGQIPNVTIAVGDANQYNYMGDIHNHPSGDGRLSEGERTAFLNRISQIEGNLPGRTETIGIAAYVVAVDSSAPHGYRIYAHTKMTPADTLGHEVNPDAQPCS